MKTAGFRTSVLKNCPEFAEKEHKMRLVCGCR